MITARQQYVPQILLVDDSEDDFMLAQEGFSEAGVKVQLHHVENGIECMDFLRRTGAYTDAPRADLILLDLNMPLMGGREVLGAMLVDPKLKHLPVIVMTTSAASEEVLNLYRLRCNAFMIKPTDFNEFVRQLRVLCDYWFTVIQRPPAVNGMHA
jgi:two-component system, chemotaxis family, response regulator Rcp1